MTVAAPPEAMSRPTLATKVAWSGVASACGSLGAFLAGVFVARSLGAEAMGKLAFLIWLVETTALVLHLGLTQALTRFVAETGDRSVAAWSARRLLGLTIVGTLAFPFLAPFISKATIPAPLLAAGVALFLFRASEVISRAWLTGAQDFRALARINVASAVVWLPAVALGAAWAGLTGVVAGYAFAAAVGCVPLVRLLRRERSRAPDPLTRRRLVRYATWLWLAAVISAFVWSQMEIVFLERYSSVVEVANFAVALRLTGLAVILPLMLSGAFLPHFAELIGIGDHRAVSRGYAAGTRFLALLLFPLCLGLAAIAPLAVPLIYGEAFEGAVPHAMVLSLGACLAFTGVGSSLINGAERPQIIVKWGAVGAAIMVILLVLFVPDHGAWAAVWVRVGVQALMTCIGFVYIARFLHVPVPLGALARIFCAAASCGAAAHAVVRAWPTPAVLPFAIALGAVVYVLGLRLLRAVDREDAAAFHRFGARAPAVVRVPLHWLLRVVEARP